MNSDENIPYRTSPISSGIVADQSVTDDEFDYDTLRSIYLALKSAVNDLDNWHVFDIKEDELKIKQQIYARRLAFDILSPLLGTVEDAIARVDDKYRSR